MGQMAGAIIPQLNDAIARAAFQQQLGQASNQMYQPPTQIGGYDPYTASRRPNYMPYGPNQQFYQPIYQPRYSQPSPFDYNQPPVFEPQPIQQPQPMVPPPQQQQPYSIPYSSQQPKSGGVAARLMASLKNKNQPTIPLANNYGDQNFLPTGTQYAPIPYMTQGDVDARNAAAAAAAQPTISEGHGGFKKGGGVHDDGIASLLKR